MSIGFVKKDEETYVLEISYAAKSKHNNIRPRRRVEGDVILDRMGAGTTKLAHIVDYANKAQKVTHKYTYTDLPPGCILRTRLISYEEDKRIRDRWIKYNDESANISTGSLISTDYSVGAVNYNTGKLTVKVNKHRAKSKYKIKAEIRNASSNALVATKSLTLDGSHSSATTFSGTFDLKGLQPATKYKVTATIYLTTSAKDYLGGSKNAGTFSTPALSSYLSTPTVERVEVEGLSHTAKVYWNVSAKKANSYYKLFYLKADDVTIVDSGIEVPDAPVSGYSSVTVASEDIASSRDVTFFVRAYSTLTAVGNFNESNRVSEYMYSLFEWDEPKTMGGQAIVTADEWNRCKEWVGAKVPAFKSTEAYQHKTTIFETVTNEEVQAVLDALDVDITVNDGTRITAGLYNQIASAINS